MKFLLDQDVYAVTLRFLRGLGHDVVPVAQIGCSQADDSDLLGIAQAQDRIFVKGQGFWGACLCQRFGRRCDLSPHLAINPECGTRGIGEGVRVLL